MAFPSRLKNELIQMQRDGSKSGLTLIIDESDTKKWLVAFTGPDGSLYAGEAMQLEFVFTDMYPIKPPLVQFIGQVPLHPHVYSNGQICLSILTKSWTPELTVESVVVSIISMLSSCKEKKRPPDDRFATSAFRRFFSKKMSFVFHDDNI